MLSVDIDTKVTTNINSNKAFWHTKPGILIIASVGTMGPSLLGDNPFKTVKGLVDYV